MSRIDRRVRKEAKLLAREVSRALKRSPERLELDVRKQLATELEALRLALARDDRDELRLRLFLLDDLADKYIAFTRKSTTREYVDSIAMAVVIALLLRAFVVEAFKIPSGSMEPTLEVGDHLFVNKFVYGIRVPFTTAKFADFRGPKRGEVIVFIQPCEGIDFIKRVIGMPGDRWSMLRDGTIRINGRDIPRSYLGEVKDQVRPPPGDTKRRGLRSKAKNSDPEDRKSVLFREVYGEYSYRIKQACAAGSVGPEPCTAWPRDLGPASGILPSCADEYDRPERYGRIVPADDHKVCPAGSDGCLEFEVPKGHVFVMGDNRDDSRDSRAWGVVPIENIKGKAIFIWWSSHPRNGRQLGRMGKFVH